jgi:hypothetical protein
MTMFSGGSPRRLSRNSLNSARCEVSDLAVTSRAELIYRADKARSYDKSRGKEQPTTEVPGSFLD